MEVADNPSKISYSTPTSGLDTMQAPQGASASSQSTHDNYDVLDISALSISSSMTSSNDRNSPGILDLPAELRCIIFEYVLGTGKLLRRFNGGTGTPSDCYPARCESLLLVSKLINQEAIDIFYGTNQFWIQSKINVPGILDDTSQPRFLDIIPQFEAMLHLDLKDFSESPISLMNEAWLLFTVHGWCECFGFPAMTLVVRVLYDEVRADIEVSNHVRGCIKKDEGEWVSSLGSEFEELYDRFTDGLADACDYDLDVEDVKYVDLLQRQIDQMKRRR